MKKKKIPTYFKVLLIIYFSRVLGFILSRGDFDVIAAIVA